MRGRIVVGLKLGLDHVGLLELSTSMLAPGGRLHLVSYVQVSKSEDEMERLQLVEVELKEVADRYRSSGIDVTTHVGIGPAALGANLATYAGRVGADLLVIGLAKRSRVGKALLGSDAQSALMQASCPVLATQLA